MSSILHLRHRPDGHARVSEVLTVGRTGYWRLSVERALSCEQVALWEFHPDYGGIAPFVAIANITDAYLVKWIDMRRAVIEFDTRTIDCEPITPGMIIPSFHVSGVLVEKVPDPAEVLASAFR